MRNFQLQVQFNGVGELYTTTWSPRSYKSVSTLYNIYTRRFPNNIYWILPVDWTLSPLCGVYLSLLLRCNCLCVYRISFASLLVGISLYLNSMTNNPYVDQIIQQTGCTEREVRAFSVPMRPMTFPCVIHGRTFESHDDYINAMYDYLDSM